MWLKILVLSLACSLSKAWPILLQDGSIPMEVRSILVQCDDDVQEIIGHNQSTHLQMSIDELTPGCTVHWRLGIKNSNIEHYGFQVMGTIDIREEDSNNDCNDATSYLQISDIDIGEEASDGTLQKYCGDTPVTYLTYQDSINIKLVIGEGHVTGSGFNITITPKMECGGLITSDALIKSPEYPDKYPKNSACIWEIKIPDGSQASLTCSYFKLWPQNGRTCPHYLMEVIGHGISNTFCGESLSNKNSRTYPAGNAVLYFRSNRRAAPTEGGFKCSVKYSIDTSYPEKMLARVVL